MIAALYARGLLDHLRTRGVDPARLYPPARVAELEQRLSRITLEAESASGNASRAEGLLVARFQTLGEVRKKYPAVMELSFAELRRLVRTLVLVGALNGLILPLALAVPARMA